MRDQSNRRTTRTEEERPAGRAQVTPGQDAAPQGLMALQSRVGNAAVVQMLRGGPLRTQRRHRHTADEERQRQVQRSAVHDVLRSGGRPLDRATRTDMETRFGEDFSDVRIHNDHAARASAAEVQARAYTSGNHVVIGAGGADRHTLAHELTHVIQQRQGPVAGTDNGAGLSISDPSDRYERAAEANATRILGTQQPSTAVADAPSSTGAAPVQRAQPVVQRVHEELVDPSDLGRKRSSPGAILWRFDARDPQRMLSQGFTAPNPQRITTIKDYIVNNTVTQFISTTTDRGFWYKDRRYRYEIHPGLSNDPDGRTGLDTGTWEGEVVFTKHIGPETLVSVFDRKTKETGFLDPQTGAINWIQGDQQSGAPAAGSSSGAGPAGYQSPYHSSSTTMPFGASPAGPGYAAPGRPSALTGPSTSTRPSYGYPSTSTRPSYGYPSTSALPSYGYPSTSALPSYGYPSTSALPSSMNQPAPVGPSAFSQQNPYASSPHPGRPQNSPYLLSSPSAPVIPVYSQPSPQSSPQQNPYPQLPSAYQQAAAWPTNTPFSGMPVNPPTFSGIGDSPDYNAMYGNKPKKKNWLSKLFGGKRK